MLRIARNLHYAECVRQDANSLIARQEQAEGWCHCTEFMGSGPMGRGGMLAMASQISAWISCARDLCLP